MPGSSVRSPEARVCRLVVGTAGHIDHGKSALVERLTGTHPDRLKEEKERGLTTDIGYAHFELRTGSIVGIVDVPGHERFVKNMVAAATGIDYVLLVVAADDGVMPQTREHLQIMSLLGLERGAVVLSKIDLVDAEFAELAAEDLRSLLAGTFLERAPVFPVSSVTGGGLDALKAHLEEALPKLEREEASGAFRMPIQRVFSAKGFGTVVTGIPVGGRIDVGAAVEILPAGESARVRGIQAYGLASAWAGAGQRAALNLSDLEVREIGRGDVVATPGCFRSTLFVEARFRNVGALRKPIEHMSLLHFHTGTTECLGRMAIMDRPRVGPGEEALVQFRLDREVVVAPGDRYVARATGPNMTVGGGVVLGETDAKLRRMRKDVIEALRAKDEGLADAESTVEAALRAAGAAGAALRDLPRAVGRAEAEVRALVKGLAAKGRAVLVARESRAVHTAALDRLGERALAELASRHAADKLRRAFPRAEIQVALHADADVFAAAVARLVAGGRAAEEREGRLRDARHDVTLSPRQQEIAALVEKAFIDSPYATPRPEDIPALVGATAKEVEPLFRLLVENGTLVRVGDGVLFHRDAIETAGARAVAWIREKGDLVSADFKDVLGSTRKYVIPLLEHLDALGVTKRDGPKRKLGPKAP